MEKYYPEWKGSQVMTCIMWRVGEMTHSSFASQSSEENYGLSPKGWNAIFVWYHQDTLKMVYFLHESQANYVRLELPRVDCKCLACQDGTWPLDEEVILICQCSHALEANVCLWREGIDFMATWRVTLLSHNALCGSSHRKRGPFYEFPENISKQFKVLAVFRSLTWCHSIGPPTL